MKIDDLIRSCSEPIEEEIAALLAARDSGLALYDMIRYQLGWADERGHPVPDSLRTRFGGKKLRGALCLLSVEAVSGDVRKAVPAAAALELIHNFSLVHDDVEDADEERRYRPTVWKVWGVPQAVNTGSAMQALVNLAVLRIADSGGETGMALGAIRILNEAMLRMTEGQHLDIGFQDRDQVSTEDYSRMASLKTGALIEAATWLGAMIGGADEATQDLFRRYGMHFGLAFQARDDFLGTWGDPRQTGKPVGSDILARKKNLPIVFALSRTRGDEHHRLNSALQMGDVEGVMQVLEAVDARGYVLQVVADHTALARKALEDTGLPESALRGLRELAEYALGRER